MTFHLLEAVWGGRARTPKMRRIHEWDHNKAWPFNPNNPKEARRFMLELNMNGEKLPRRVKNNPVIYALKRIGGRPASYNIYPGLDLKGRKLPVWYYGRLDVRRPILDDPNKDVLLPEAVKKKDENTRTETREPRPSIPNRDPKL